MRDWTRGAVTADGAISTVKSGMIFVHGAAATPTPLLEALVRDAQLRDVTLYHLHTAGRRRLLIRSIATASSPDLRVRRIASQGRRKATVLRSATSSR